MGFQSLFYCGSCTLPFGACTSQHTLVLLDDIGFWIAHCEERIFFAAKLAKLVAPMITVLPAPLVHLAHVKFS